MPRDPVVFAKSGVGVAVRAGAPKPDISSTAALKKALIAAKSIGYSTGPSGVYIADLFRRLGIADEVRPKLAHQVDQLGRVPALTDHLETGALEQARESLAHENLVVRQHDPGRVRAHSNDYGVA